MGQHRVQGLAGNAQVTGEGADRHARQAGQHIFPKDGSGMGRYTFTHHSPLVIILKIKLNGVLTPPFEGDAPRTVDMYAVALWLALQSMEIKTRNI